MTQPPHLSLQEADAYFDDRTAFLRELRESRPVAPVSLPGYGRAWLVTRYDDVRAVLTDPRMVRDVTRWPGGSVERPSAATGVDRHMLHADPPEHTRLRRIVQRAFSPRRAALRPMAQQIADELLDELRAARPVVDLLQVFARPFPIAVLCELLDIPRDDRAWMAASVIAYDDPAAHDRVERELAGYLAELVAARRADPGDDLISALASPGGSGEADEETLTDGELVATAFLLVMAGFDTTVNLITSGALALLTHPASWERLRYDPTALTAAVEELLRYTSPVNHANDRFVIEPVVIGDVTIPDGEWVLPVIASANRDPAHFPDPDVLDLDRDTTGHLAFGHGIHHCLGAPLARVEAEVGLSALLRCSPRLSLAVPLDQLRWRRVSLMNGLQSLPVRVG